MKSEIYREGVKNRELGKEAPQIFWPAVGSPKTHRLWGAERGALPKARPEARTKNMGTKPTPTKTDCSITSGITFFLQKALKQCAHSMRKAIVLFLFFFLSSGFTQSTAREWVGNSTTPDIHSEKWTSILSEIMIAYSNAKSDEEIGEIDRTFKGILSGKYASNILFLESIRNELGKAGVSAIEINRHIRQLFEEIVSKMALMFSSQENRQYLAHHLGSLPSKNILPPPTLQSIREKICYKLERNELKLFDPNGRAITDLEEVKSILEQVNVAIGIPSYKEGENIRIPARKMFLGLAEYFHKEKVVLLGNFYHDVPGNTSSVFKDELLQLLPEQKGTNVYTLMMSTGLDEKGDPITGKGNNLRNFFEILWLAKSRGSLKGAALVDADLKTIINSKGEEEGIAKWWVKYLLSPIVYPDEFGLERAAQFVSPVYCRHEYDGGMTNNCCVAFVKLASNRMIRQPIGGDFGFSPEALEKFLFDLEWNYETQRYGIDIAMSLTAALNKLNIVEAELGVKIHDSSEGKVFQIASEVFGAVVKLLTNKKDLWASSMENAQKTIRIGQRQEALPQSLCVDYGYYKRLFYGNPLQEACLEKDLLTRNQILEKAKHWGLEKARIESLFNQETIRTEMIKPYILSRLEQLIDTEENNQVRISWMRLFEDRSNSFLDNIEILYNLTDLETTQKALDLLIGIGIDVSNPWLATRYFLEVIIWGETLIGKNIEHLKYFFINHEQHPLEIQSSFRPIEIPNLSEQMSLATLRETYEKIMDQLSQLILSNSDYRAIDNEVRRAINLFYKRLIEILVKRVWRQLGIPENSRALCYFREAKTFVSDLDLIYLGPDLDRVNRYLTSVMFSIGIKRDIFAIDMIAADAMNCNSSNFIGGQYYRNIEAVTFNLDFDKFFSENFEKEDLSYFIGINNFKANQVFVKWRDTELQDADTKELYYVGINHLLRGLALKYSIKCGRYADDFWKELSGYLTPKEIKILSDANSIANHIRNLYQMYIARRSWILFVRTDQEWLNLKSQIAKNIEGIFAQQGVPNLRQQLRTLREQLDEIRNSHLGNPEKKIVLMGEDLPEIQSEYWYALNHRVNEEYLLISASRFGFDPLSISPLCNFSSSF